MMTAIDGKPAVTRCSEGEKICSRDHLCELRDNWKMVNQIIFNVLDGITLADMSRPLEMPLAMPIRWCKDEG